MRLGFQHAGQLFYRAAHLIHRQVASLVGDLGGKHSQAAAGAPILQAGVHFAVLAAGQAAYAEAFHHQCPVVRCQQRMMSARMPGTQPQYEDGGVQLLVKLHGRHRVRAAQKGMSRISRNTAVSG